MTDPQKPIHDARSTRARKPKSAPTTAGSGKRIKNPANGLFVTKLTNTVIVKIAKDIEAGTTPSVAARLSGVHVRTFERWISAGMAWFEEAGRTEDDVLIPEAQFVVAVEEAIAKCRSGMEQRVASAEEARVTLEVLGRRFSKDWAKRDRLDVGNPEGETFRMLAESDLSVLSRDEIGALREILVKLRAARAGGDVIEMPARRAIGAGE